LAKIKNFVKFNCSKGVGKMEEIIIGGQKVVPLYSQKEIQERVRELGDKIFKAYEKEITGKEKLVVVLILRGAIFFGTDLYRILEEKFFKKHLFENLELDTLAISTYGNSTQPGEVKILKDLNRSVQGKNILVVEDIVDTGETLKRVQEFLMAKKPRSIKIAALIDKTPRRKKEVQIDFVGFSLSEPLWVVGYGLDYKEAGRGLPFIGALHPI